METFFSNLLDHLSEATIFVGTIGFFLQLYFKRKSKEKEITFSRLQQKEIEKTEALFEIYNELVFRFREFRYIVFYGGGFADQEEKTKKLNELGEAIYHKFIDFRLKIRLVKLFIEPNEALVMDQVKALTDSLWEDLRINHLHSIEGWKYSRIEAQEWEERQKEKEKEKEKESPPNGPFQWLRKIDGKFIELEKLMEKRATQLRDTLGKYSLERELDSQP